MPKVAAAVCRSTLRAIGVCCGWLHHLILRFSRYLVRQIRMRLRIRAAVVGRLAFIALVAGGTAHTVVAGGHWASWKAAIAAEAGMTIEKVDIKGQKETSQLAVLEMLRLDQAPSLAGFDVWAARQRLQTLPWIESAQVRKIYPDALQVRLKERQASARWQANGRTVLIDDAGRTIAPLAARHHDKLPLVVGKGADGRASALLAALKGHPAVRARLSAAVLIGERRWDLMLDNGMEVRLPEVDFTEALRELSRLEKGYDLFKRDVLAVDLRLPDRLLLRLPQGVEVSPVAKRGLEVSSVGGPI